jgi:pimeloyl-ACP methyl ester carboxylesterase
MMSPAVILVPGMSSVGSIVYAPLLEELKKANFERVHAVDLASVDCTTTKADLKPTALNADIELIRLAIKRALVDLKRDVVVVGHSYGGTPALYACEGMWKSAQPPGTPGVLSAALISSSLSLPGNSVAIDRAAYGKTHGGIDDSGAHVEMEGEVRHGVAFSRERNSDADRNIFSSQNLALLQSGSTI